MRRNIVTAGVALEGRQVARLDRAAARLLTSRSAVIRLAVEKELRRLEQEEQAEAER